MTRLMQEILFICPFCNFDNSNRYSNCWKCGERLKITELKNLSENKTKQGNVYGSKEENQ